VSDKSQVTMDLNIQLNNIAIDEAHLTPNTVLALRLPKELPPVVIVKIQENVRQTLLQNGIKNTVVCIPDKGSIDSMTVSGLEAVRDYVNIMISTLKGNITGA